LHAAVAVAQLALAPPEGDVEELDVDELSRLAGELRKRAGLT
jgi:hypothetical protein